jgi:dynein light intermediate chain 1
VLYQLFSNNGTSGGAFPFSHRASTVERDVLLVPAGWDTFGKIRALRDGFDCAGMANGWEWDVQVERIRRSRGLPKGSAEAESLAEQQVDRQTLSGLVNGDRNGVESAIRLYEDIIEDWNAAAPVSDCATGILLSCAHRES